MKRLFALLAVFVVCTAVAFPGVTAETVTIRKPQPLEVKRSDARLRLNIEIKPNLEVQGPFSVQCAEIAETKAGRSLGGAGFWLYVSGSIKNNSPFKVKILGRYKGAGPEPLNVTREDYGLNPPKYPYEYLMVQDGHEARALFLDPGKSTTKIAFIGKTGYGLNQSVTMPRQYGDGTITLEAYPVNDKDEVIGEMKKYVVTVTNPQKDNYLIPAPSMHNDPEDQWRLWCPCGAGQTMCRCQKALRPEHVQCQ